MSHEATSGNMKRFLLTTHFCLQRNWTEQSDLASLARSVLGSFVEGESLRVGVDRMSSLYRHQQPFESDDGVHLKFNYWMQKPDIRAVLPSEAQDILTSFIIGQSPSAGVTIDHYQETKSLIVVVLNGLDSEFLSNKCNDGEAPFLAASSSMPIISVRKFQSPKMNSEGRLLTNPNPWFYNDTKSIESELLHTMVSPILAEDIPSIIKESKCERVLWQNTHSLIFSLQTTSVGDSKTSLKWLVCRPHSLASEEEQVIRNATMTKVNSLLSTRERMSRAMNSSEVNLAYASGKFLITNPESHRSSYGSSLGKGYYFINAESTNSENLVIESLVLVWESGSIDILRPVREENSEHSLLSTYLYRSRNKDNVQEESSMDPTDNSDLLEAKLSHVFPLYHDSLLETSEKETITGNEIHFDDAAVENSKNNENFLTCEDVLSKIKVKYQYLPSKILDSFVIGKDSQEILGYLVEDLVTIPEFVSTNCDGWSVSLRDLANSLSLSAADMKTNLKETVSEGIQTRHLRFDESKATGQELEEGEEIEQAESIPVENEVISSLSLLDRINKQAIHWLFRDTSVKDSAQYGIGQKRPRSSSTEEEVAGFQVPLDAVAMDCEMCETADGLELTRITILHPVLGIVLDTLVKPMKPITNYHTEFSGVTSEQLNEVDITLKDVQTLLRLLISKDTILIGHSFDNDLRALQLFHNRIIDTSALFLHHSGYPYKHSLKKLAKDILSWDIQDASDGHDSIQDAAATLFLAIAKVEEEIKLKGVGSNEDGLLSLLGSKHYHQRFLSRHTVTSTASIFSDIYSPIPRYSWFECMEHKWHKDISWHVIAHPSVYHAARWEREGLGYPVESDAVQALADAYFAVNAEENHKNNNFQMKIADTWRQAFQDGKQRILQLQSSNNSQNSVMWISVDVSSSFDANNPSVNKQHSENDGENAKKRPRLDAVETNDSSNSFVSNISPVTEIDAQLQSLYKSLPSDSKMIVFVQRSMLPLRKMIAKKLRRRWDMQSANKKRVRVAMPSKVANYDWDNQLDENKLLEEANAAARCCLFVRYK